MLGVTNSEYFGTTISAVDQLCGSHLSGTVCCIVSGYGVDAYGSPNMSFLKLVPLCQDLVKVTQLCYFCYMPSHVIRPVLTPSEVPFQEYPLPITQSYKFSHDYNYVIPLQLRNFHPTEFSSILPSNFRYQNYLITSRPLCRRCDSALPIFRPNSFSERMRYSSN